MKLIKNYLNSEELVDVVNVLVEIENATIREITKIGVLYQLLVEDAPQLETCNEYYDLYVQQTDVNFEKDCTNVYLIDYLVDKELSITNAVKQSLLEMNEKIGDFKIEDFILQLEKLKEVGLNVK